jgi:hypothetical protein
MPGVGHGLSPQAALPARLPGFRPTRSASCPSVAQLPPEVKRRFTPGIMFVDLKNARYIRASLCGIEWDGRRRMAVASGGQEYFVFFMRQRSFDR